MSFIDLEKKSECICGEKIKGRTTKGEIKEEWVLLRRNVWAKVCKICGGNVKTAVEIRACFSSFRGWLGAEINGDRICAIPREGYRGPRRGGKRPPKAGKHAPPFNLKGTPALCFTDTGKELRNQVISLLEETASVGLK